MAPSSGSGGMGPEPTPGAGTRLVRPEPHVQVGHDLRGRAAANPALVPPVAVPVLVPLPLPLVLADLAQRPNRHAISDRGHEHPDHLARSAPGPDDPVRAVIFDPVHLVAV